MIDIIILIFIAFGFLIGFKRGFTRELVSFIEIFVIIVLSFILKNPISVFFYNNLPFINFGGFFKDITVINILFYEVLAFIVVFFTLTIIFKILLAITKIFESILTATIILGIPSKILGGILGIIQYIVYTFIILYILSLPMFNINLNSKVANTILTKTPFLNKICDTTLIVFDEISNLKDEYNSTNNVNEYNQKVLNIMIDNNVITKDNASKLIKSGKLKGVNIE